MASSVATASRARNLLSRRQLLHSSWPSLASPELFSPSSSLVNSSSSPPCPSLLDRLHGGRQLSTGEQDPGILELRAYTLKPEGMGEWLKLTDTFADLRRTLNPSWLGMFTSETGGNLTEVLHFYQYTDLAHREKIRRQMLASKEWTQDYIGSCRKHVQAQSSAIFVPALSCMLAGGAQLDLSQFAPSAAKASDGGKPIYELRRYQLHPGYGTMPKALEALGGGLQDKVKAGTSGQLVLYASSDVGTLNQLLELWRYPSAQASIEARKASRGVESWRQAIAQVTPLVQTFTTTILSPTRFSPWQ